MKTLMISKVYPSFLKRQTKKTRENTNTSRIKKYLISNKLQPNLLKINKRLILLFFVLMSFCSCDGLNSYKFFSKATEIKHKKGTPCTFFVV